MASKALLLVSVTLLVLTMGAVSAAEIKSVRVLYGGETDRPLVLREDDQITAEVAAKGKNESVWVGATIIDSEGDELDLEVRYLEFDEGMLGGSESKETSLDATLTSDMETYMGSADGLRLVVRLWQVCVRASECSRAGSDGDTPCEYCRRNGYHMEYPIGSPSWTVLPPFMATIRGW